MPEQTVKYTFADGREFELRMYAHPGKFEGEFAVAEHVAALDPDAECGTAEGTGHHALVRGPVSETDIDPEAGLTPDERAFLLAVAGVIVSTDSMGFVHFAWFDANGEMEGAWDRVEVDVENYGIEHGHAHPADNGEGVPCNYLGSGVWDCGVTDQL